MHVRGHNWNLKKLERKKKKRQKANTTIRGLTILFLCEKTVSNRKGKMLQQQSNQNRPRCRQQHHLTSYNNITLIWVTLAVLCSSMLSVRSVSIENAAYRDIVFEISDHVPVEKCADFLLDLEVSFKNKSNCSQQFCEAKVWNVRSHELRENNYINKISNEDFDEDSLVRVFPSISCRKGAMNRIQNTKTHWSWCLQSVLSCYCQYGRLHTFLEKLPANPDRRNFFSISVWSDGKCLSFTIQNLFHIIHDYYFEPMWISGNWRNEEVIYRFDLCTERSIVDFRDGILIWQKHAFRLFQSLAFETISRS